MGDGTRGELRGVPTRVSGEVRFERLVAGGGPRHGETCGITAAGETWCWGKNYQVIANGVQDKWVNVPTRVVADPGFREVLPGPLVVCGITADDALHCWGDALNGQLANGAPGFEYEPTRVMPQRRVRCVAMGWEHPFAGTVEGDVWCWGDDNHGQLGNPSHPFGWLLPVPVWAPGG